jgi:predicted DNA-binding transcriptional regulator AlpA
MKLLTLKECAEKIGVSPNSLRQALSRGHFNSTQNPTPPPKRIKIGGKNFFREADVNEWISNLS